jgi:hypothetical protein
MVQVYVKNDGDWIPISTDINFRYVGNLTSWSAPAAITASDPSLTIEDQLTGKILTVPVTQTDLNNINIVLSKPNSYVYAGGGVAVSPLAGYVLVTYSCTNVPSELITFEALFKTTLDNTNY